MSQVEVFLGIFGDFFYFFEFKFNILNPTGLKPVGTGTGPVRFHRFLRYPDRLRLVQLTLLGSEDVVRVSLEADALVE
jgi:hypothetical protein